MVYRRKYVARRRKYARKGAKGVKRLSKPMRLAVTRVAKKVVSRAAENKGVGYMIEDAVSHNSAIGSSDIANVFQSISVGTDSRNRIGDRITPKSLKVHGLVSVDPQSAQARGDIYARVMILSQKDVRSGAAVSSGAVDVNTILRPCFGSTAKEIPFSGNTNELLVPINTDKYRVYMDRLIKLSLATENAAETGLAQSARWTYTFTKKNLPASLTYDEGNGDWANNFAPFFAVGYAYADGTAPDTLTTKLVSTAYAKFEFEDL